MPRLGSRVRIPSPAPDFPYGIKGNTSAWWQARAPARAVPSRRVPWADSAPGRCVRVARLLRRQADCLDGTSFEGTLPPLESRVIVWPDEVDFGANFVREFPRSMSKQVRHPQKVNEFRAHLRQAGARGECPQWVENGHSGIGVLTRSCYRDGRRGSDTRYGDYEPSSAERGLPD